MALSQSGPVPALNCATVIGSSSSEEAKIGGMTPEELSFKGRCEASPWNIRLPICRLGYWMSNRRCARSMKTMAATTASIRPSSAIISGQEMAPWRGQLEQAGERARQAGDDARHDDERGAVADAARGDLLAEPHQEHGAADQADDRRDAEEPPGVDHHGARLAARALEAVGDAVGLEGGQRHGEVARVLVDLLAALLAFLLELLQRRHRRWSSAA